jgi:multiple sugar transport system permease protein
VHPGPLVRIAAPIALVVVLAVAAVAFVVWIRRRHQPLKPGLQRPLSGWLLLSPWLIGLAAFTLGPILAALWLSFCSWNMIGSPRWVGLAHYLTMLGDARFYESLFRTIAYAALVVPLSLGGGLATAALLTAEVRGRDAFKAILYIPSLFAGAGTAVLWVDMFNAEHGIVNRILGWIGLAPVPWLDAGHAFATIVLMNLFWIGGSMIVLYAGMRQIPPGIMEAAAIDGAGAWRRFRSITLPLLAPILLFLGVTTTIGAFQVFTPALFVAESSSVIGTPGDSLRFLAVDIYDEAFNNLRMGEACARAVVLFVLVFLITMVQMKWARKWGHHG